MPGEREGTIEEWLVQTVTENYITMNGLVRSKICLMSVTDSTQRFERCKTSNLSSAGSSPAGDTEETMKKDTVKSKPQFYHPSTVIVYFQRGESVDSIFEEHGLDGVRISYFMNQWAVEVPHGKEEEYIELLDGLDSVLEVNKHFLEGDKKFFRKRRYTQ